MGEIDDKVSVTVTEVDGDIYLRLYDHPTSTVVRLTPELAINLGEMLVKTGKECNNQKEST